jgi:predicted metal-dependent hydrolase
MAGDPVATAVFNALSLTFPDGERLFMDAVRNYRSNLSGKLLEDAKGFIAQEAIHTREHVGLNAGLDRSHYPIDEIEANIKGRLAFLRTRGRVAMLGVTIAMEHFTAMMADLFLEEPEFWDGVPEDLARLWQWHAMEETEHKAVAFDVFQEISKNWKPSQRYGLRVRIMLIMTVMFVSNITKFSSMLLIADGMKPWKARLSVLGYLFGKPGLFRKSWKSYWDWFRPWRSRPVRSCPTILWSPNCGRSRTPPGGNGTLPLRAFTNCSKRSQISASLCASWSVMRFRSSSNCMNATVSRTCGATKRPAMAGPMGAIWPFRLGPDRRAFRGTSEGSSA